MIIVAYTTGYRAGGPLLERAAHTLARAKHTVGHRVVVQATETKRAFVDLIQSTSAPIEELHFVGHSGMYGPMFGTTSLPEQLSPHEWRSLVSEVSFGTDGAAYFHACRTGRWFAAFFARTFGVPTWGHHLYTTVSLQPDRYVRIPRRIDANTDVFVVGQPGRKSHGVWGTLGKHLGILGPEPMQCHEPTPHEGADYDSVARLYDETFQDIRVRRPEWRWLSERLAHGEHVLDLGCGTGALLRALGDHGVTGVGADVSGAMLDRARAHRPTDAFVQLNGPQLPFGDNTFDAVVSMLSWRYLDWDPVLLEVARVLRPGGRLLVVDMVARPAGVRELPRVVWDKLRTMDHERRFVGYSAARARLVTDPGWANMLHYNPIRAEHEYVWFLESRFPGRRVETLNVARHSRVLAFDSGPVTQAWFAPQSYP